MEEIGEVSRFIEKDSYHSSHKFNYMRTFGILLLLISSVTSSCGPIFLKVTKQYPTIETKNNMAIVNGVLGKTFHKKFEKYIDENPQVKNVQFGIVPGSMNDEWNVKTCRLLHENCMNTMLTDSSIIASGGVDLFLSGNNRTITDQSKIGVHSWRDAKKDGIEYPRDAEEHELFIALYNKIDIDTAFYWYTLKAAPGKDIHWMTPEEIEIYKIKNSVDSLSKCY